jgi:antitoxin VapB
MAINIRNAEAEELARRLAAATGDSLTGAITTALRERLSRVRSGAEGAPPSDRHQQLHAIATDAAGRWTIAYGSTNHGALLYDESGLPA